MYSFDFVFFFFTMKTALPDDIPSLEAGPNPLNIEPPSKAHTSHAHRERERERERSNGLCPNPEETGDLQNS